MFQFESLIDSTDFATVRRSMHASDSPITEVLFVHEERLLATVAGLITDEHPTDAQRTQFARYHNSDGLKFWVITESDHSATTVMLPEDY